MPVPNKTPSQRAVLAYRPHGSASEKPGGWNTTVSQKPKVPPQAQQAKKPSERHQAVPSAPASKPPVATPSEIPQELTNVPQEQLDSVPTLDEGNADSAASNEVNLDDEGRAVRAASRGVDLKLKKLKKIHTKDIDTEAFMGATDLENSREVYCFSKNEDIETATTVNRLKTTKRQAWIDANLTPEVGRLVFDLLQSDKRPSKKFLVEVLTVAAALKKYGLAALLASDLSGYKDTPLHAADTRSCEQQKFRKKSDCKNKSEMVVGHIVGLGVIVIWNLELPPKQRMSIECLKEILNDQNNMRMESEADNRFHETVDRKLRKPSAAELTDAQLDRLKEILAVIQAEWFQKAMIKGDGQYLYDHIRQRMKAMTSDLWKVDNDKSGLKPADIARNDRRVNREKKEAGSSLYFQAGDFKYARGLNRANPGLFRRELTLFSLLEPGISARLNTLGLQALKRLFKNASGLQVRCDRLKNLVIVAIARRKYGDHMKLADVDFENDHQRLVSLDFLIKLNVQVDNKASCGWIRRIVTHKKNALPALASESTTDSVKAALLINTSHGNRPTFSRHVSKERNLLVLMARFLQSMPQDGSGILFAAEVTLDRHVDDSAWRTAKEGKLVGRAVIYTGPLDGKFVISARLSTIHVSGPRRQDGYPNMRFRINKNKVAQANEFSQTIPVGSRPEKQRINSKKATR